MNQPGLQWCKTPGCNRACRLERSLTTGFCQGCRIKTGDVILYDDLAEREVQPEGKGHPEFHRILDEMRALHVKKAADYGTAGDPIANCHSFSEWGVTPSKGMMMRVGEKVQRLKAFCTNGNLQNEGIEDSLKDIVGCAILALICYREEAKK